MSFHKKIPEALNDIDALVPKSSDTDEYSINATSLGHGIGNVISMGDSFAKGEIPINPTNKTINDVNGDKNIGAASKIPMPDATGDFYICKPRWGTRSVITPERLEDYFWEG
ncbi:hypothetical protein RDI58_010516 [Solanum bulbocastanum]|uniref:Uncharacterized protein n=1 Tax=Solanum bulbocastanum TaxID=147425 RepID=A0AAN8TPF8_SOLBU